jgi:hypothetical protein
MALAAAHGITLAHGGLTLRLRPTLRAAATLERLHDGFANLFRQIADFDTATIKAVIEATATDRGTAETFLAHAAEKPLKGLTVAVQAPLIDLCRAFIPDAPDTDTAPAKPSKPMPWADFYRELFRTATGWLNWPPEAAWNATPDEITEAFTGHLAKLKAIHGGTDAEAEPLTQEQKDRNVAAGLDPEFDRDGLRALKAKHR